MAQLGVLFDAQKLGSGFYGYTAFRILFTAVAPRDLAGCTLYHGEVGDGRVRPYCIAIETDDPTVIARVRQALTGSMVRGLLPPPQRFLDGQDLQEEVLALAARITAAGEITQTQSRWLQEAWQRAQGQTALNATGAEPRKEAPPPKPAPPRAVPPQLPDAVPLILRLPLGSVRAFSYLVAFSAAGALAPWFGYGIAACAMLFLAGALLGIAMRWRLGAEQSLSETEVLGEAKKLLGQKPLQEVAEKLGTPPALASPLLRRMHASTRSVDMPSACLMIEQHERADRDALDAATLELKMHGWMAAAAAGVAAGLTQVMQNNAAALADAPQYALAGLTGCTLLQMMAALLAARGRRLDSNVRQKMAEQWLPLLAKAMPAPKTQFDTLEKALHELVQEFQAMRVALERRRDAEFVDTMADLRASIDQLAPVLAGFREPFVLQAVPAAPVRPKAMSATA